MSLTIIRISAELVYVCMYIFHAMSTLNSFKCNTKQVEKLEFRSYCAWMVLVVSSHHWKVFINFFHGWNFVSSQCRCANYRPSQWIDRENAFLTSCNMYSGATAPKCLTTFESYFSSFTASANRIRIFNFFLFLKHLTLGCLMLILKTLIY
jgi:hypothetical protein